MSRFLNDASEYSTEKPTGIDFDDAVKLPAGGSTCDIYRTRWQRHEVFVKRLKESYRNKPLYLDALEKEFEIGVGLKHPSLPVYHVFQRDYIIMDYIDGTTLADMIRRDDQWLANEKNIIKLLKELIEVVGYLHRHNVVHCDIKPDNIMITANNSNLVLIDFDKSYTDALNDTSGHPSKYGLSTDDIGRNSIDFHAIGMLVERLKDEIPSFKFTRYKRFKEACNDPEVNCEILNEILVNSDSSSGMRYIVYIAGNIILLGLLLMTIGYWFEKKEKKYIKELSQDTEITSPIIDENDSIIKSDSESFDTKVLNIPVEVTTAEKTPMQPSDVNSTNVSSDDHPIYHEPMNIEDVYDVSIVKNKLDSIYSLLFAELDSLELQAAQSDMSKEELNSIWQKFNEFEDSKIDNIVAIIMETYPGIYDADLLKIFEVATPLKLKEYRKRHANVKRIYQK